MPMHLSVFTTDQTEGISPLLGRKTYTINQTIVIEL